MAKKKTLMRPDRRHPTLKVPSPVGKQFRPGLARTLPPPFGFLTPPPETLGAPPSGIPNIKWKP